MRRRRNKICEKTNYKDCNVRIDKCMREEIKDFNKSLKLLDAYFEKEYKLKIVACCCGHGKYSKTIVLKRRGNEGYYYVEPSYFEHFSGVEIPRTRNFYKRDSEGYYYIPEVNQPKNEQKSNI